ncbi:MAG: DUF3226 domain-containing protein [Saprospiraceae bacterium]
MAIRNILIVESFNDKSFIELLLSDLKLTQNTLTETIEIIDLHKFPDPDNPANELRGKKNIGKRLNSLYIDLRNRAEYKDVSKVGIILDMDSDTLEQNLKLVNEAIEYAFKINSSLSKEGEPATIEIPLDRLNTFPIEVSCFFTKDQTGKGNLETLLYEIRRNPDIPVPYADCLARWRDCVSSSASPIQVAPGVFQKMWADNFLRAKAYELSSKDRKSIINDFEDRKHRIIERLGKEIFDLSHPAMDSMRDYLSLFKD